MPKQAINEDQSDTSFLDQTMRNLRAAWRSIAGDGYNAKNAKLRPDLPEDDYKALISQMQACLSGKGGAVSARARAAGLGEAYLALDNTGRRRFLGALADHFGVDHAAVQTLAAKVAKKDLGTPERLEAENNLRKALESPRRDLLLQFTDLPDGVKFLVDMRADLLAFVGDDESLRPLERDMKSLLATWFDVGFLQLQRITWEKAPAALLEKFIAYEAVHAIESWDDLKNRLSWDRRLFAYFHPRMPDEPLIFVEVALVKGIADNVQVLLDEDAPLEDPKEADTAIFYSISNAQKGLAGISFGDFLIKRVVGLLSEEFPNLTGFATLSPIPGFRKWLTRTINEGKADLISPIDRAGLKSLDTKGRGPKAVLKEIIKSDAWVEDRKTDKVLKAVLPRLAAKYLLEAKRQAKDPGAPDTALDPVAHFHLSNGARVERLNWLADRSDKGLSQSLGLMVNYLYKLDHIDKNHEAYMTDGLVAVSSSVKNSIKN